MSRDQRSEDNWALLHASQQAKEKGSDLIVVFCLAPGFLGAAWRQYHFMLEGLRELESRLRAKGIPFVLLSGRPEELLPPFLEGLGAGLLVTDFDPLRPKLEWKGRVLAATDVEAHEVDAHNIVPCWTASLKREFSARTFRPKFNHWAERFLTDFPSLRQSDAESRGEPVHWEEIMKNFKIDRSVPPVDWIKPGEVAAANALKRFCATALADYGLARNDPSKNGQSELSPYLHFGQLSAQRVALEVGLADAPSASKSAFLEELMVRRELADNYCHYTPEYDSFGGFPSWAKETLDAHRFDQRDHHYSEKELELAQTHDDLWNAAQLEMVRRGKMHGYMRMYWAKKILEWVETPEEALRVAIRLNDRYELDGRDPNGYAGIAWSIGGVHDRPWPSRNVFGKVRYMSYSGARSKFDVQAYVERIGPMQVR